MFDIRAEAFKVDGEQQVQMLDEKNSSINGGSFTTGTKL